MERAGCVHFKQQMVLTLRPSLMNLVSSSPNSLAFVCGFFSFPQDFKIRPFVMPDFFFP